jgi:alpha-galactosidase
MARIVFIGAGSAVFTRNLVADLITFPELADTEVVLMDVDAERLDRITQITEYVIKQENARLSVRSTLSRREALPGADYVVITIAVGGLEARAPDIAIPDRYGVGQCIGDTLGPGGIFRGLRHLAVFDSIAEDIMDLCPDALVLQYSNPMAILTWRTLLTPIRTVGLCHSVQGTSAQLAEYCGVPVDEMDYWVAGINHQAWFLQLRHRGTDLLPTLKAKLASDDLYGDEPVRIELFRRFGYFVTESSAHASEYYPYFRKTSEMIDAWGKLYQPPGSQYGGGSTGGGITKAKQREVEYEEMMQKQSSGQEQFVVRRSGEYGAEIVAAVESGSCIRINGNVRNDGHITNLPEGCCVEVPCLVDGLGVHPCFVGDLPPQLAALNRASVGVQEMVVRGHMDKDREAIYQAMALDPLTAAVCTLDQIHSMADEMFEANRPWITL